jgi:sugar/nucleoside kinase (ribokinase family)
VKPNEVEALRWHMPDADPRTGTQEDWLEAARMLSQNIGGACCMTLGERGSIWVEGERATWAKAVTVPPPHDIVGAGDCFASALVCALGAGSEGPEAMAFAHLASSVVIRKIGTTGTAAPHEIMSVFEGLHP